MMDVAGKHTPLAVGWSQFRRHQFNLSAMVVVFALTVVPLSGLGSSLVGSFGQVRIASLSLTAAIGAFIGLLSWTLVAIHPRIPASAGRVTAAFASFFVACAGSAVLGIVTRQGIQFLSVLVAALGVLVLSAAVRTRMGESLDDVAAGSIRLVSFVLGVALVVGAVGAPIQVSPRTSALVALLGISWFLSEHRAGRKHALWWAFALTVAVALSLSRSALAAAFILVVGTLVIASPHHRLRNAMIALVLTLASFWAITSWTPLHQRFFSGDLSLTVAGVKVNAEGRTHLWAVLWSEVPNDPVLGHGLGAASARTVEIDPTIDQPHNDYLRLIYDVGIVGIGLFVWSACRVTRLLRRARRSGLPSIAPLAALNAGLAILIVMITDNPLDYPFVMIPLGALIGLGLGAGASRGPDSDPDRQPSSRGRRLGV